MLLQYELMLHKAYNGKHNIVRLLNNTPYVAHKETFDFVLFFWDLSYICIISPLGKISIVWK